MARVNKSGLATSISSHDEAIIQQIKAKHGKKCREFNFKPLMHVVKNIFHHSLFSAGSVGQEKSKEETIEKEAERSINTIEKLELQTHIRCTIHQLAWEITSKWSQRKDAHETTLAILDLLHDYSWEAKVVLILATFAMSYGEFWLTAQPLPGNPLLQSLSMLKQPPCLQLQTTTTSLLPLLLQSRLQSLQNLVERMLDLANYIVELKEHKVIHLDEVSTTSVQIAAYLIIVSVVTCISSNMALVKIGTEHTSLETEIQVLKKFHHILTPVHDYLHELYNTEKGNRDKQNAGRPHHNSKMVPKNDIVLHHSPLQRRALHHSPLQQPRWRY